MGLKSYDEVIERLHWGEQYRKEDWYGVGLEG